MTSSRHNLLHQLQNSTTKRLLRCPEGKETWPNRPHNSHKGNTLCSTVAISCRNLKKISQNKYKKRWKVKQRKTMETEPKRRASRRLRSRVPTCHNKTVHNRSNAVANRLTSRSQAGINLHLHPQRRRLRRHHGQQACG